MKKIAIIGCSPGSEMLAPFDDPEWEIWVIAEYCRRYPRVNKMFEIHNFKWTNPETQKLADIGIPFVVSSECPATILGRAHVEPFDYQRACDLMGRNYLASTCDYMLARAIMESPDVIGLWGMDMAVHDSEYFHQNPTANAWIGLAKGMGIDVFVPEESPLFKRTYIYGLTERPGMAPFTYDQFTALADDHQARIDQIKGQIEYLQSMMHAHDGTVQAYRQMARVARAIAGGNDVRDLKNACQIK